MKKLITLFLSCFLFLQIQHAQTTLSVGDASLLWYSDNDDTFGGDDFGFVTFVDLAVNTRIYFNENGANNGGVFDTGEGVVEYLVTTALTAGSIVGYLDNANGTWSAITGTFSLSTSGDQIFIFQDGDGVGGSLPQDNPVFIHCLQAASQDKNDNCDYTDSQQTDSPSVLTPVTFGDGPGTFLALGTGTGCQDENDHLYFNGGTMFASVAAAKAAIQDPDNWTVSADLAPPAGYSDAVIAFEDAGSVVGGCADAAPPMITCPAPVNQSNDAGECEADITYTAATATDDCTAMPTIAYSQNSGTAFPVGTTTVTATATDDEGNTATCTFNITVNDTENPTANCPATQTVSNDAGQCGANVNFSIPNPTDNCPGATSSANPSSGSFFSEGTTSVTVTATDASGNQSTCTFNVVVNDTENPTANCPATQTVSNDAGQCGANVSFSIPNPTDNCPGATSSANPSSGSFFSEGTTSVTVTATDASGNQSTCTFNVVVNDTENPTANCPATQTVSNDAGQCGANVSFSIPNPTDNCPGATSSANPSSGSFFSEGTTSVTVTATDASGNQSTCTFNVVVNDTENPTANCPATQTVSNDAGQCGANVNFSIPNPTDNCPGATSSANPSSGSFFSEGTTSVTVTATDASGNQSTCTFNVVVNDIENPTANCPATQTVSNDAGQCGANVSFSIPNPTDNCPGATSSANPSSGSFFSEGTTSVTVTATDASGNQSTCTFNVVVNDTENPTANCPATQTVSNDAGQCGANVSFSIPNPTDNCPGATSSANPSSGSVFGEGTTTVTVTATDASANQSTCTFNVVVNDTENPTITCPADVTQPVNASCQSTVPDLTPTVGTVIATSSAEFSNTQGQDGWFYGKYVAFNTAGFTQLPNYTGFVWNNAGNGTILDFPQLDANGGHPQFEDFSWAVRRWVSDFSGQVQISGDFFDRDGNCGDGAHVRIFQNGAEVFQFLNITTSSTSYSINLTIAAGDLIDFAIDPKFDVGCDDTHFTATITAQTGATVSDNCPGVTISQSPLAGTTIGAGVTIVTLTATDASGNQSTCTVNVTVSDSENPTANCPTNITQSNDAGQCGANVSFSIPNPTDNCPGASSTANPASGSFFSEGTTSVTVTATDISGNQSTCTFNVTVNDTENPTANCPANVTQSNDAGQCGANVSFSIPNQTDNCPGATSSANPASGSFFSEGTTSVTVTATDASGNQSTCTFNVTVNDTENPTANCPSNVTQSNEAGQCGANVSFSIPNPTDNCPGATSSANPASGSFFSEGTTSVTVTATDASGNQSTCTFNVTVNDTENPTANCPSNVTQSNDAGQCGANVSFSIPNPTDNCPGATSSANPASGSFFSEGTTSVTVTATDASGNQSTCTFSITVNDTENPTANCPSNVTQSNDAGQCGANVSFTLPNSTDNCPGATSTANPASGSFFSEGTSSVTVTATDASGNQSTCTFSVTVNDTENPTANCPSNVTQSNDAGQCGANVSFSIPNPTDNCPGATSSANPASGSFFSEGTTTVTVTATDASANQSTCTFSVTVNDTENPTANCPSNVTQSNDAGQCGANVNFTLPNPTDNCPGATSTANPVSGSFFNEGTTTVTVTATDASGNQSTCTFSVTVNDTENPTANCPANVTQSNDAGQCGANVSFSIPNPGDSCPGATSTANPASGSFFSEGATTVTVTTTDASANQSTCTFNVTVNDTENPTANCPSNVTQSNDAGQCGANVGFVIPNPTDNCPGATSSANPASGSFFSEGTTTVTVTATDASANQSTCTFSVTVNDTEAPIPACPTVAAQATDPGQCEVYVDFPFAGPSDNCPGTTQSATHTPGFFPVGTTTVSITATDASGNTGTCSFDIVVNDAEGPSANCPSNVTQSNDAGQCGANVNFSLPDPTDNCPGASSTANPTSGSFFSEGTTTVTVTATDASANQSTCTFSVTVNDTESPTANCPSNVTQGNDIFQCGANVSFTIPDPTDNCPGATATAIPTSGSSFSTGTTLVTVTATDASGNQSTCTFNVTVNDIQNPSLSCQNATVTIDDMGNGMVTGTDVTASVTDNCLGTSSDIISGQTSFGCSDIGNTFMVTVQATDAAGNTSSTCMSTITVQGDGNTLCPADTELYLEGGSLKIEDVNGGNSNDDLTVTFSDGIFTFTDVGGLILDASSIPGATGSFTSTVTVPEASFSGAMLFLLETGTETLNINSFTPNTITAGISINTDQGLDDVVNISATIDAGSLFVASAGEINFLGSGSVMTSAAPADLALRASKHITLSSSASINSSTGDLFLNADEIDAQAGATIEGTDEFNIVPWTSSQNINIGGDNGTANELGLSATDLAAIVDGFVYIAIGGNTGSGTITLSTGVTLNDPVYLRSPNNGTIVDLTDGSPDLNVGTNLLGIEANVSPGSSPGIQEYTGNVFLSPGHELVLEIGGTTPGTDHDQLKVNGTVDLGGISLNASAINSYVPAGGDELVIVNNDGGDPVSGQFMNLNEGDAIIVGGKGMLISYVGGDGNDVTLTTACDVLITDVSSTPETCDGDNDGTITITATCTTCTGILYSINGETGPFQTDGNFTGLAPGSYSPFVKDSGDDSCNDDEVDEIIGNGFPLPADPVAATTSKAFCSSATLSASLANTGVNVSNGLSANERVVWVLTAVPAGSAYAASDEFTVENCGDSFKNFGELAVANFSKVIRVNDPGNAPAGTYSFDVYIENCVTGCLSATISGFSITVHAAPTVSIAADPDGDLCLGQLDVQYDATIMSADGGTYGYAWCAYNSGDGSGTCFNGFDDNTIQNPSRDWTSSAGVKSVGVTVTSDVPGCSASDLYSFNVVAPTMISCPSNQSGTLVTNSGNFECAATFTWNNPEVLAGPCDPVTLTITISGGSVAEGPTAVSPGDPFTYTFEELGIFTVTYELVDAVGNMSTCSFTVTVDGLPCGFVDNGGIGCADNMNSSAYDPNTGAFTLTANNCALTGWPFSSDQAAFVFSELCGDGEIVARVTSVSGTGFAGVMMRDSEAPGAPMMAMGTNRVNKVLKQVRTLPGYPGFPQFVVSYDQFWVRIVRQGNQLMGFASMDGVSWTPYLNQQVFMSNNCIRVGLFTYSEKPGNPITATFDNVFVTGVATPLAPGGQTSGLVTNLGDFQNLQGVSEIRLYPNPTSGMLNMDLGSFIGERADITLFNSLGQQVMTHRIDGVQQPGERLDVTKLEPGMYNVVFKIGNAILTKRVVIAR